MSNNTALIFGAGVIANGYAMRFVENGLNLIIVSWDQSSEQLAGRVREQVKPPETLEIVSMVADCSNFEQLSNVYEQAYEKFGKVDVVVNGSGGNQPEAVVSSMDDFANMGAEVPMNLMMNNYFAKRYSIQLYAKWLHKNKHEGSVVNITSMSGIQPLSKVIDYSAAFAAVENLTQSAAFLYGKHQIGRVNNVAVGFTIGQQNKRLLLNEDGSSTPRGNEILQGTSQNRFLDADEIAGNVLYLANPEQSRAINGHTLKVDGGFNLVGLPATS